MIFKRTLHSKIILPVAYEECLTDSGGGSDAATLWRVRMQSAHSLPLSKGEIVVFKTYEGTRAQRLYKVEADAYGQLLRSDNEGYITKHFASFSFQGMEKSIIVLEVHQDIQPSNILVFPQKDTGSRFDVNFKLADFGLAEIGRISLPGDSLMTKRRGNRMYSEKTLDDFL
ncbi:hypothetical protein IL306_011900 [Fusarium sp. DS 682]|nr:hypothetical protein IL306_011900 [Fusarium sp. DS 682]